jgi:hypothetical protein
VKGLLFIGKRVRGLRDRVSAASSFRERTTVLCPPGVLFQRDTIDSQFRSLHGELWKYRKYGSAEILTSSKQGVDRYPSTKPRRGLETAARKRGGYFKELLT